MKILFEQIDLILELYDNQAKSLPNEYFKDFVLCYSMFFVILSFTLFRKVKIYVITYAFEIFDDRDLALA